jgi:hypothetical protein
MPYLFQKDFMKNTKRLLILGGIPIVRAGALVKSLYSLSKQRYLETVIAFPNLARMFTGNNPVLLSIQAKNLDISPRNRIRRHSKQCSPPGQHEMLMKNQNFTKALNTEIKRDNP